MRKKELLNNPSWFKKGEGKIPWNKGKKTLQNTGDKNPIWKGDKVGYGQLHKWVRSRKPVPVHCEKCKKDTKLQLSNIGGKYTRELSNWEYLCAKCHVYKDGTVYNLRNIKKAARKLNLDVRSLEPLENLSLDSFCSCERCPKCNKLIK